MTELDETAVRRFAYLLGHVGLGVTEVRAITSAGVAGIGYFDRITPLLSELRRLDGSANLYAGRNPRPPHFARRFPQAHNRIRADQRIGGKNTDIEYLTSLYLDVDAVRPTDVPSTGDELQRASTVAQTIAATIPGAVSLVTGNGAAVLVPLRQYRVHHGDVLMERCRGWEGSMRATHASDAVRIDSMQDLARIIRIPGTLNIKGVATHERPHRRAAFLDDDAGQGLLERILSAPSPTQQLDVQARLRLVLQSSPRFSATWHGTRSDLIDQSRSGYDMAIAAHLAGLGWNATEIVEALRNCPAGRGCKSTADYITRTVNKALRASALTRTAPPSHTHAGSDNTPTT